jgi:hypothetical protein
VPRRAAALPADLALELAGYTATVPDTFAITWVSPAGEVHLGVVGEAAPHEQALADLGLADRVCVVGGFLRSEADLADVSRGVSEIIQRHMEAAGDRSEDYNGGWSGNAFTGAVELDLYRVGSDLLTELEDRFGDAVVVRAPIQVLDGTLEDLDAALAEVTPTGAPEPYMTCGPVRFSSIPAELDEFPALDAEAQAAVDQMAANGGVDTRRFIDNHRWSVAQRTDDRLVLLGQAASGEPVLADFVLHRQGGDWAMERYGPCQLRVEGIGLSAATTIRDPDQEPDPTSDELPVLIREQQCAGGQPPVDREVVPVVTESDTTVEIVVLVAPVKGGAVCPGNPWHPVTVTLAAPLGDPEVLDTSTQPAQPRQWPPVEYTATG